MRMEMTSFMDLWLNPIAQSKFLHTLSAGYVSGAFFVLAISSYYLLKGRDIGFAKRSFSVASTFGIISVISVLIMGDESGYEIGHAQPTKLAAMEGEWHTQPAPAAWNMVVIPNQAEQKNDFEVQIPYMAGMIVTRSIDKQFSGLTVCKRVMLIVCVAVFRPMRCYNNLERRKRQTVRLAKKQKRNLMKFKKI